MRDIIQLQCTECKRKNYTTTKNKKTTTGKLEFKKYCRFCVGTRFIARPSDADLPGPLRWARIWFGGSRIGE